MDAVLSRYGSMTDTELKGELYRLEAEKTRALDAWINEGVGTDIAVRVRRDAEIAHIRSLRLQLKVERSLENNQRREEKIAQSMAIRESEAIARDAAAMVVLKRLLNERGLGELVKEAYVTARQA